MTDSRPINCRERLRDEGKGYPRPRCLACNASITNGGLGHCPHEDERMPQTEQVTEQVGEPKFNHQYRIGPLTAERVFKAAGITNLSDMQAVLDQVEKVIVSRSDLTDAHVAAALGEAVKMAEHPLMYSRNAALAIRALITDAQRSALDEYVQRAVAEERERCAKIAEKVKRDLMKYTPANDMTDTLTCDYIARAIREMNHE